jgi:threonyl-tRNA synthetase
LKWYPDGVLIFDLIQDYAFNKVALPWGAFKMKNPLIYRTEIKEIEGLMGEFRERDYVVTAGRDEFIIRPASDPGGFPFVQKLGFSYKQMPLKVYEEAQCFRYEQAGEVVGLARVRNFNMTDMHAFCKNEEEARTEFEKLCKMFAQLMNEVIGRDKWVLGWEGTEEFYEKNRDWLVKVGKDLKVPAFFKLMKETSHYYVIKNEYQVVSPDESNIQVSTVQWDTKDGERFRINYVDACGRKVPVPVIIHASSFGSIERTLWSILETAGRDEAEGKPPCLPFWLSPSQVRLCPVSDAHLNFCEEVADKIQKENIRVDIDDRTETISNKVRKAEMDWVSYILVIGEKEKESKKFQVRVRRDKSQKSMTLEHLINEIKCQTADMPFRPRYLPRELSKRPIFIG